MNYEIELKAHVYNRAEVIETLNKSAVYGGHTEKNDVYYGFPNNLSARIRSEKLTADGKSTETNFFTYKRKRLQKNPDGTEIEVNEENEFSFSEAAPLVTFFTDMGAQIKHKKSKSVEQWMMNIEGEAAHVELCTVPPLGDFLEIEIIKNQNDAATVAKCKELIQKIFTQCNIPLSNIESRYYTEMLEQAKK